MSTLRRGSLRVAVAGAMLLAGALHGVAAHAQQASASRALTMQASWPASSTFMENFNQFADRVNKTTGGRVHIKTSAAGTMRSIGSCKPPWGAIKSCIASLQLS